MIAIAFVFVRVSCSDLLTRSARASDGFAAESVWPGYYGLVIEAGAFSPPLAAVRPPNAG
jgi:hypothetical protein